MRQWDKYNELTRDDLRNLGISYDLFTRTTTGNHARVVRDLFRTLHEHGFIFEQTMLGAFSSRTGNTLPDRYIEGTCPICGFTHARGDQCDNCGNQLDPIDLIDPRSKIDGTTPSSARRITCSSTCPRSATSSSNGSSRRTSGGRTSGTSPSSSRARSSRGRSRATSTGASGFRCRATRKTRTNGSTCGSTPSSATYQPPSNGRSRAPLRTHGATGGQDRSAPTCTSWARTTSSSTRSSGPPSSSDTEREESSGPAALTLRRTSRRASS